ncbi:ABC transporter ATP-binding protein [Nocardia sp. BMG111209]|uniref:ABC transporter ATP-binding protein n=1 Tax=Nocardia sp. BMG111209 TaxID=1160137 RepID=UPI0009DBF0E5|nr:ABC transporter ATP-binding protein [Nocardia sp. BMG111209]
MPSRGSALLLVLRYYGRELARRKRLTVPALLAPALGNACQLYAAPLVVAAVVQRLATGGPAGPGELAPYLITFGALLLLAEVFWRIGFHCMNRVDCYGIESLYIIAMDALLAKDAAFFHTNFAGSLTKRSLSFASRFEEFVDTLSFDLVASVLPLAFAAVMLWRYDPVLVAVLLGLIVFTGLLIAPLIRRRQRLVDEREAAVAAVSGHVADCVTNMAVVRAFAAEEQEAGEHRRRVADQRRKALRSWDYANLRIDTLVTPLVAVTNVAGLTVALASHGRHAGVEMVLVAFTYYWNATSIMFRFNMIYRRLESALTEAAQFTELLLTPPAVVDPADPEPLRSNGSEIRFEQVDFAHPGTPALFRGLELQVADGTKVGLVGRSGGGKTTLTQLLLRTADIGGGRITVGGQDIARLRQADLRGLIAYVPQDPSMFHRTLAENIRFARPGATDAEVRSAAEAAHVLEFADALPQGMDTPIGERGVKLSGGQRQRVALARAILRDAPILLLDEATSALDSESEVLVQQALWRVMSGRTALVVAHRLSTVAGMDRLVVLDQGRIVEQGTHEQLLRGDGNYAQLWRRQSGGFLGEQVTAR